MLSVKVNKFKEKKKVTRVSWAVFIIMWAYLHMLHWKVSLRRLPVLRSCRVIIAPALSGLITGSLWVSLFLMDECCIKFFLSSKRQTSLAVCSMPIIFSALCASYQTTLTPSCHQIHSKTEMSNICYDVRVFTRIFSAWNRQNRKNKNI